MPVWNIRKISNRYIGDSCCTLKRCGFARRLPEKYCSISASDFVPITYLVPFLFKQEKSLLAFALHNIDALTDKWTTGTSRRHRNKSESQIFVFVFLRFAETNLISELSSLFFLARCFAYASVRPFVRLALMLRPSVRSSIRAETSEICGKERIGTNGRSPSFPKICFSSALLPSRARPSLRPNGSRRDFAATNALEERAGAPYFSERVAWGASCAGGP